MRGSKRQRKPGVWELRAYIGRVDGIDRQKSVTFRGSAAAADKALRKLIDDVEDGKHAPRTDPGTVAEMLERWLTDRHRDWAPRTASENRYFVERHLIPRIGKMQAAKVRPPDLKALYAEIIADVEKASIDPETKLPTRSGVPTARRAHVHLSAAFAEAVRDGELGSNPCARVRPPKAEPKPEREVSIEHVVRVMAQAHADGDDMMAVLIRVALATGARRGELGALRWSDVDFKAGRITISRALTVEGGNTRTGSKGLGGRVVVKGTKTGNTKRLMIDTGTMETLRRWRDHCEMTYLAAGEQLARSWFVWGGAEPVHPDRITGWWVKLAKKAGVPLRFHDIRHATGSFLASAGVGPAEGAGRLGNSEAVFLGTYLHAAPAKDGPIAELLGAAIDEAMGQSRA
ncbi:MAG TPA: site-specific integrase [Rhodoglobus sp.]|nr:site-specific integrase [Rhodoglobus sp.]